MVKFKILAVEYSGGISSIYTVRLQNRILILKKYYEKQKCEFIREKEILRKLKHENIIKPVIFGKSSSIFYETIGLNLAEYIITHKYGTDAVISIIEQLANGLHYLEQKRIVHFDLKPSNIIISDYQVNLINLKLKIIDFGSAKYFNERIMKYDYTSSYCSLEYLLGYEKAEFFKDCWSLGCILFELVTRQVIFNGVSSMHVVSKILNELGSPKDYHKYNLKHLNVIKIDGYDCKLKDLEMLMNSQIMGNNPILNRIFRGCLKLNPEERMTAIEIIDEIKK